MGDVMTAMPRIELQRFIYSDRTHGGMKKGSRECIGFQRTQQHYPPGVKAIEDAKRGSYRQRLRVGKFRPLLFVVKSYRGRLFRQRQTEAHIAIDMAVGHM